LDENLNKKNCAMHGWNYVHEWMLLCT
jgi:hypothetical protein